MRRLCCCVLQNIALGSYTSKLSVSGSKEMCQNQRSTLIVNPIASLTFEVRWVVHCLRLFPCDCFLNKRMKKKKQKRTRRNATREWPFNPSRQTALFCRRLGGISKLWCCTNVINGLNIKRYDSYKSYHSKGPLLTTLLRNSKCL